MSNVHGIRDFARSNSSQNPRYERVGAENDNDNASLQGTAVPYGPPSAFNSNGIPYVPKISEYVVPRFTTRSFVFFISMVDIIVFLAEMVIGGIRDGGISGVFARGNGMGGPSAETLHFCGGKLTCPDIYCGGVWRLVTPIVLHAGIVHIAANLFFQLHFGFIFELRWTTPRFIMIYFLSGIGASLLSAVGSPYTISVGASGALFGILGADITYLLMNWHGIPAPCSEMCGIVWTLILNMLFAFSSEEGKTIDSWAHGGGLISGICLAAFICPNVVYNNYTKCIKIVGALFSLVFFGVLTAWIFVPGQTCPAGICSQ